ncbi:MAG: DNA-protecting protein DprA [Nocardioidaceae bacterium]|nr:DNA-protecting protein DprA [Nocardioidaceae bacterium]MDQ3324470.1 DNA-protecting protein DprA [Actinomycetota bacterium]
MSTDADRLARAWLTACVEPGLPSVCSLLAKVGPREAMRAIADGRQVPGVLGSSDQTPQSTARAVLARAEAVGLRLVCPGDREWPTALDGLCHAGVLHGRGGTPYGLWVRGEHALTDLVRPAVAIVGARSSTAYGDDVAADIAAGLTDAAITVTSGAAYGIDAAAHRGALAVGGNTVAVLACGADVVYPRGHDGLLQRIAHEGLVVSEAPPGAHPTKVRFLARNRLIAALTQAVVVVEASWRSGSLNTLKWAGQLGRVGLGVPGPVTSGSSTGVHLAIREQRADLVTCAAEVREAISVIGSEPIEGSPTWGLGESRTTDALDPVCLAVLESLPASATAAVPADRLAERCGLDPTTVRQVLTRLTERGLVSCGEGGWRMRQRRAPLPAE